MKYMFIVLLSLLFLFFNLYLAPAITIFGISPDFILIFIICISPHIGITTLPLLAVLLGACYDSIASGGIYINFISYLLVSLAVAVSKIFINEIELPLCIVAISLSAVVKGFIATLGIYVLELTNGISIIFFLKQLPNALYCAVLAVPIFFLCRYLCSIEIKRNRNNNIIV